MADSLYAVKRLVYDEKRYSLGAFCAILADDYRGHEALRREVLQAFPKFGNDEDGVDSLAAEVAARVLSEFESIPAPDGQIKLVGFYSLDNHHAFGRDTSTTPDGRLQGEPVSENLSPVYGADRSGVTACLKSIMKLPLSRTVMGGLNLQFAGDVPEEKISSLVTTYFSGGGLHLGFTQVSKNDLKSAQVAPERYRALCVRMYGFSEYFTALSPTEQLELIDRTGY